MKDKDLVYVGGVAAVLGIILWNVHKTTPLTKMFPQPEKSAPVDPNTYTDITTIPITYPPRSGHEITCLIEHGLAPLWKPRPNLFTWMECPPSEVDDA